MNKFLIFKIVMLFGQIFPICSFSQQIPKKKPNIIFIITDDLGYGDVGVFFQNERKKNNNRSKPFTSTPYLDKMASEGAILTAHYAAAPVCAPSRASLLSGLSQGHANVRDNQFDKALSSNYTIGNVMQMLGYKTAAVGKWGLQGNDRFSENGASWPSIPTKIGFDYFYGYMRHGDGHEHYPEEGIYRGKKEVYENDMAITEGLDKCYTGDLWTAAAKKWISSEVQKDDEPFFLYLAYDTPHAVLELPTQSYPAGGGLNGGLQWKGIPGQMINTSSGIPDSYLHPDYANATYDNDKNPNTPEVEWPETYKRYATSVRRIDDAVNDLLILLQDLQINNNTMIVFTSDNGPSKESYLPENYVPYTPDFFESYGHFDGIKRDLLEGGERMPTIVKWADHIEPNKVIDIPSISYDWLPTFTQIAGLEAPASIDGVSLVPSLTGKGEQKESLIYSEYYNSGKTPDYEDFSENNRGRKRGQMQMIRKKNLVGVRYDIHSPSDDFEIYDITKDTHQTHNMGAEDSIRTVQEWMKNKVIQVRRPNLSANRPYDAEPMATVSPNNIKKNLWGYGYSGNYPWLPKLDNLIKEDSIEIKNLSNLGKLDKFDYIMLKGYIQVYQTGLYQIALSTAEATTIRIHEATLFDNSYNIKDYELSENVILEKGFHPIRMYFKKNSKVDLTLSFNNTRQELNFFHEKN